MATTTAFPSLSVPQDDTMDMSSPANQAHDADIDLDFGDAEFDTGGVTLQEDEQMLTDGEQTRPATATDDMMDDDVQLNQEVVQEADMQDTPDLEPAQAVQQDDEELIDYGEDDFLDQEQPAEDTTLVNATEVFDEPTVTGDEQADQVDEEIVRQPEDVGVEQPAEAGVAKAAAADFTTFVAEDEQPQLDASHDAFAEGEGMTSDTVDQHEAQQPQSDQLFSEQPSVTEDSAANALGDVEPAQEPAPPAKASAPEEHSTLPALTVDTTAEAYADGSATPTDTGLHPMTVYYGDIACPLFKSKNQRDGLLKDDNLASLSLHELMRNCRQRLAFKIGSIPEEQEFTLAFDHMGLMLVENSRAAFEHSLNDVLEVYLHLHQNDGSEEIPALSLTLTQQQFSNQLAVLKQAAEVGKGMSAFVPLEHYEDEDQQYGEEEHEQYDGVGEKAAEYEQQDAQYDEVTGEEEDIGQHFEDALAQEEQDEQEEEGHYGQEYPEGEQPSEETADDQHQPTEAAAQEHRAPADEPQPDFTNVAEAAPDPLKGAEHGEEPEQQLAEFDQFDMPADDAQRNEAADDFHAVEATDVPAQEAQEEAQNAASTATSQTVRGDAADDTVGEYDEDFIDWDDDSDLTTVPSDPAVDGKDDFAAFLNDGDGEEAEADEATANQFTAEKEAAEDYAVNADDQHGDSEVHAEQLAAAEEQPQYFGSEDFLGQYDERQDGAAAPEGQEKNGAVAQYDEQYDQADTHEEQYQDGYQPGEDDEQFHTAHDFLEGGDYEHGLEHSADGEQYTGEEETAPADEQDAGYDEDPGQLDLGDDIGFDDETTEEYEARIASHPDTSAFKATGSPLGKRSFDEAADDDFELEEPEAKKARAG